MARPEEKAQAMLNKWTKMRKESEHHSIIPKTRPYLASQCEHLHDAERWRRDIIREISSSIKDIQNAGLGEHRIRDLNDQINKSMREKWHWNRRIVELGGVDYNRIERKQRLEEGDTQDGLGLKGSGGYRYFGAAKELPGVKELFTRHAAKITKRKRGDVYKYITPDYYGLRDEEDGVLLELEAEASKRCQQRMEQEYKESRKEGEEENDDSDYDEEEGMGGISGAADAFAAHIVVPTQDIVAQIMLERKKKELLEKLIM